MQGSNTLQGRNKEDTQRYVTSTNNCTSNKTQQNGFHQSQILQNQMAHLGYVLPLTI